MTAKPSVSVILKGRDAARVCAGMPRVREYSSIITTKIGVNFPLKYSTNSVDIKGPEDADPLALKRRVPMTAFANQSPRALSNGRAVQPGLSPTCAVQLVDRRTGAVHRVNGSPLVVFTRRPEEAAADLLSGRDSTLWEARIDPIGAVARS